MDWKTTDKVGYNIDNRDTYLTFPQEIYYLSVPFGTYLTVRAKPLGDINIPHKGLSV